MQSTSTPPRPVKAVILAAGANSITGDGLPVILHDLGGKQVIDFAVANAAQIAAPADTYVVVGYRHDAVEVHLGPDYHYVTQEPQRGTGDAVRQLEPALRDFDGDLLILYGEAPYPIVKVTDYDGIKVYFERDNWVLLRFSGTESLLRIFAEADTPEKARELVEWLQQQAGVEQVTLAPLRLPSPPV